MEDPWASSAAGAWGTPAKLSSSSTTPPDSTQENGGLGGHRLPGEEEMRSTPPQPAFDVGDPWGVAPTPAKAKMLPSAHEVEPIALPTQPTRDESADWGHGDDESWGVSADPAPALKSASPPAATLLVPKRDESHDAVWSLDSPAASASALPSEHEKSVTDPTADEVPLPISSGPSTPPRTFSSFPLASSSAHASPASIHSLHSHHSYHSPIHSFHQGIDDGGGFGFESSSHDVTVPSPKSPSFGDDFGGFSTGPGAGFGASANGAGDADPWGSGSATSAPFGGEEYVKDRDTGQERNMGWGNDDDWNGDMSLTSTTGAGVAAEDGDISFRSHVSAAAEDEPDSDGWGGAAQTTSLRASKDHGDGEWDEAQRRVRVKQERAPQEKIDALATMWTELAQTIAGPSQLPQMTGAEELQNDETVKRAADEVYERLRVLALMPPDINTYPPVITSLITHERFTYALTRPNPAPSSSFLTAAATRRPRRVGPLGFASNGGSSYGESSPSAWTSRSRLGEPDAPAATEAVAPVEDSKSRWSFWGKRPAMDRQLTTSGGGMLEVKQTTPGMTSMENSNSAATNESTVPAPFARPASSRTVSISSKPSRPTSPALSSTLSPSLSVPHSDPIGHSVPSGMISQTPPTQAPSAVSRFFGRLSRKPSAASQAEDNGLGDPKDLELSADDFSFLAEVPSITSPPLGQGVEDLLALEGPTQPVRSLSTVLTSNAPLPKPLAPPPTSGPSAPHMSASSRSVSASANGKFVAKMRGSPAPPTPTNFDLLGDLDFASPSSSSMGSTSIAQPQPQSTAVSSTWDDFLAFDSAPSHTRAISTDKPIPAIPPLSSTPLPPLPPTAPRASTGTPTLALSPPPPEQPPTLFPASTGGLRGPSTPQNNVMHDFEIDDFGTPQPADVAAFDDFGDFAAFDEPPQPLPATTTPAPVQAFQPMVPKPRPLSAFVQSNTPSYANHANHNHFNTPGPSSAQGATPVSQSNTNPYATPAHSSASNAGGTGAHGRGSSLDHTPTLALLSSASASRGKRWPAPPSPVAPILEPPPNSNSNSQSTGTAKDAFPFLSPPPPANGRPVSRQAKDLLDDGAQAGPPSGTNNNSHSHSTTSMFGGALAPTPPPRSLTSTPTSLLASPPRPTTKADNGQRAGGGGGLTAQDLSFFDSL